MNKQGSLLKSPAIGMLIVGLCAGGGFGWWAGQRAEAGSNAQKIAQENVERRGGGEFFEGRTGDRVRRRGDDLGISNDEVKDFAQAVRTILRESIPSRRVAQFERLLEKVGVGKYPELVALIRAHDLDGSGSNTEWEKLWANWGERDPVGAMEFIRDHDWSGWNPGATSEAKKRTMINWAQVDPEAAKRFVLEGEELARGDRDMLYFMVEGWTYVDPTAAADWLVESGMGLEGEYKSVVEAISRKGGQKELESWFAGLDQTQLSPKDRNGFAELIAGKKLENEPERAAAWLEANLDQPWVTESRVVPATASAYVKRDPLAALAWAQRTGLPSATADTVISWCHHDLNAAKQWVAENPDAPEISTSASIVMSILRARDPAAAQEWAEGLPDKAMRDRLLSPR
ncbi:MAG: hypothetical protein V4640_01390 [Verrucomicrobiota bacterium]